VKIDDEALDEPSRGAAFQGDHVAFERLFDRHSTAVHNDALRLTACWSLAEDITQATFLSAWRSAPSYPLSPHECARPAPKSGPLDRSLD
jgi:DNA-directed RNA polymerase specialized sigma24 family protein